MRHRPTIPKLEVEPTDVIGVCHPFLTFDPDNLTTTPEFVTAHALPAYFSDFRRLLGSRPTVITRGRVDTGDVIEAIR